MSPSEGFEIGHLDGAEGVLAEEVALVQSKVPDYGLVRARTAPQCLVASQDTLTPLQILVVGVVELVRCFVVEIVQSEWVYVRWTNLGKFFAEVGIGIGVIEE